MQKEISSTSETSPYSSSCTTLQNRDSAGSMTSTPYLYAPLSEELAKADKQAAVARQQQLQSVMDEAMSVCQQSSLGGVHCDNTRQLHAEHDIILPRLQQFELAQNQMALANTASLEDVLHSYQEEAKIRQEQPLEMQTEYTKVVQELEREQTQLPLESLHSTITCDPEFDYERGSQDGSQTCDNLNCSFENLAYASSSERATLEHLWEAYISVKDANELLESELHRARYERDAVLDRLDFMEQSLARNSEDMQVLEGNEDTTRTAEYCISPEAFCRAATTTLGSVSMCKPVCKPVMSYPGDLHLPQQQALAPPTSTCCGPTLVAPATSDVQEVCTLIHEALRSMQHYNSKAEPDIDLLLERLQCDDPYHKQMITLKAYLELLCQQINLTHSEVQAAEVQLANVLKENMELQKHLEAARSKVQLTNRQRTELRQHVHALQILVERAVQEAESSQKLLQNVMEGNGSSQKLKLGELWTKLMEAEQRATSTLRPYSLPSSPVPIPNNKGIELAPQEEEYKENTPGAYPESTQNLRLCLETINAKLQTCLTPYNSAQDSPALPCDLGGSVSSPSMKISATCPAEVSVPSSQLHKIPRLASADDKENAASQHKRAQVWSCQKVQNDGNRENTVEQQSPYWWITWIFPLPFRLSFAYAILGSLRPISSLMLSRWAAGIAASCTGIVGIAFWMAFIPQFRSESSYMHQAKQFWNKALYGRRKHYYCGM